MNQNTFSNKYNINNVNIIALLFSVSIFILLKPYFVWQTIFFNKIILFLVIFISLLNARKLYTHDLFIIPLFVFWISYIGLKGGYNVLGFIALFCIIYILLIKKENVLLYFKYLKIIFCISLLLSLTIYILIVFFNFNLPYNIIHPLNPNKEFYYYQYLFLVSEGPIGFRNFNIRFYGMFDEPGVIGVYAVLLLLADRFNLHSKQNIILFISGILSFSFYFYVIALGYLLSITNNKTRIYIISVICLIFIVTKNNELINSFVWGRFAIENGKVKGDNRSYKLLDNAYQGLLESSDVFWGKGIDYAAKVQKGSSTYKTMIIAYGMGFFIVFLLSFSLYAYSQIKNHKYFLAYLFVFIGLVYHRPFYIYAPSLFFVLISVIYSLADIENSKNKTIGKE
jgi:hypothetical protein